MDWKPAKVKRKLLERGITLEDLAFKHGYARITDVLYRRWVAAELIVANALDHKPEDIWPTRYKTSRFRALLLTRNKDLREGKLAPLTSDAD
jgi:Ner family transcriptional regulator